MPRTTKRVLLVLAVFIIAAVCSILADRIVFKNITLYDIGSEEVRIFTDGSEAYDLNSCALEDHVYTVTGADPHFTVFSNNAEFTRVRIVFREPPEQNIALQLFYAPVAEGFSEVNSVHRSVAAGLNEEIITLPQGAYTSLRFDFEQDVTLEGIYISNPQKTEARDYAPHPVRIPVFFCAVFIPLCVLVLKTTGKKKTDA